jgi:hypothetical protein
MQMGAGRVEAHIERNGCGHHKILSVAVFFMTAGNLLFDKNAI